MKNNYIDIKFIIVNENRERQEKVNVRIVKAGIIINYGSTLAPLPTKMYLHNLRCSIVIK